MRTSRNSECQTLETSLLEYSDLRKSEIFWWSSGFVYWLNCYDRFEVAILKKKDQSMESLRWSCILECWKLLFMNYNLEKWFGWILTGTWVKITCCLWVFATNSRACLEICIKSRCLIKITNKVSSLHKIVNISISVGTLLFSEFLVHYWVITIARIKSSLWGLERWSNDKVEKWNERSTKITWRYLKFTKKC